MQLTELETALINRLRQLNDWHPTFTVSAVDSAIDYDADRKAWAGHYADILKLFTGVNYAENEQVETEYYRNETMATVEHFAETLYGIAAAIDSNMKFKSLDSMAAWLMNRVAPKPALTMPDWVKPVPQPPLDGIASLYAELFGSRDIYPNSDQMRIEIRDYVIALKQRAMMPIAPVAPQPVAPQPVAPIVWFYCNVFGREPTNLLPFDEMYRGIWQEVQKWHTPSSEAVNMLNSMCDFVYSMDECYFAVDTDEDAPIRPKTIAECKHSIETMLDSVNSQIMQMVRSHHVKLPPTKAGKPLTLIQLLIELDDHFSKPQAADK